MKDRAEHRARIELPDRWQRLRPIVHGGDGFVYLCEHQADFSSRPRMVACIRFRAPSSTSPAA